MYNKMFKDTHQTQNLTQWYLDSVPNPILDRVIIKCDIESSKNNILLVESSLKPGSGTIVKTGPGRANNKNVFIKNTVKPGQKAFWNHRTGTYFNINSDLYVMMKEEYIQAVVE